MITEQFKQGDFKIPAGGIQNCDRIGNQLMYLKKYLVGIDNTNRRIKRQIITAYIISDRHPKFSFDRFRTAIKTKSAWLMSGTSARDYIQIFQKIYNSGLAPKKRINLLDFFDTREYTEVEE